MKILIFIIKFFFGLQQLIIEFKLPNRSCILLIHAIVEYLNVLYFLCVTFSKNKFINISGRPLRQVLYHLNKLLINDHFWKNLKI